MRTLKIFYEDESRIVINADIINSIELKKIYDNTADHSVITISYGNSSETIHFSNKGICVYGNMKIIRTWNDAVRVYDKLIDFINHKMPNLSIRFKSSNEMVDAHKTYNVSFNENF